MDKFNKKKNQKGFVLMLVTATMFMVVPTVGLAIDASFLYAVKARLSAATDAAALAAARSLAKGQTLSEQAAEAEARARAFFDANFPDYYMLTDNKEVDVTISQSGYRTRIVQVDSSVNASLFFMRLLGDQYKNVRVSGTASRRDVNLMMVLDRSGSMDNSGSCEPMKAAARQFVDQFANGRDQIGLITFGMTYYNAFPPSYDFKPALDNVLAAIDCSGGTGTAQALSIARQQIEAIDEPGALNVIVFFTDGLPNGITARFPLKKRSDTRYGYGDDGYNSTYYTYNMEPSTCRDAQGDRYDRRYYHSSRRYYAPNWNPYWNPPATADGAMAGTGNGTASTGYTFGVTAREASSLTEHNETGLSMSGCRFSGSGWWRVRRDIAYIPDTDYYGNSIYGYESLSSYKFTSGQYAGKVRPDRPRIIGRVSKNTADNVARDIRRDTRLSTVIYAIGLGDPTDPNSLDQDFLRRVANDPTSPVYNDGSMIDETTGLYVFAPDKTQLSIAFARVASEILRITR